MRQLMQSLIVVAALTLCAGNASAQIGISAGFFQSTNAYGTTLGFNNGIGLGYAYYPTSYYPIPYSYYAPGFNPYATMWPEPAYVSTTAYYGYYGGYGPWGPWYGGTVAAPLVLPAETLYGPQAMQRFLGTGPVAYTPPVTTVLNVVNDPNAAAAPAAAAGAPAPTRVFRASNATSRALARRLLDAGDRYFREQRYNSAFERYKEASVTAGDLAGAYFRQGWAALAMGQYEQSAKAFKRGLQVDPDWPRSQFNLADLYGGALPAKDSQRDVLVDAAIDQPNNPDLLFLLGVQLYFDGQTDRSRAFFRRAEAMSADDTEAVKPFLDAISGAAPPPAPEQPRGRDI